MKTVEQKLEELENRVQELERIGDEDLLNRACDERDLARAEVRTLQDKITQLQNRIDRSIEQLEKLYEIGTFGIRWVLEILSGEK